MEIQMGGKKYKVLLDLSKALMGYSEIPQDTRILYKLLSDHPDIELTGLLYGAGDAGKVIRRS